MTLAGGAVAEKIAGVTFVPSARVPAFRNHEYVTAMADHLHKRRQEQGGAWLISAVWGHVERVDIAHVLRRRDRKLQEAASRLLRVQALAFYDAARLNPAEGAAKNALVLAQAAQDPEIQALTYGTLSQVATHAGAGDRGRHYAEVGLRLAGISDRARWDLHIRRMRSLAILPGQENAALEAFGNARTLDEGQPGLKANLGIALSDLGRHQAAIRAFSDSTQYYADSSQLFYAQNLQGEIMSLLQVGMPDVAADRMVTLAHIAPFVNSARLQRDVTAILAASARWINVSGMRDARDQLGSVAAPLPSSHRHDG
jgi:tetratricopeptide (TPR) repeat protein